MAPGWERETFYPDAYTKNGYDNIDASWGTWKAGASAVTGPIDPPLTLENFFSIVETKAESYKTYVGPAKESLYSNGEIDISTIDEAQKTIAKMDQDLETVSEIRAEYGAFQNRMESAIANVQVASNNMSASRSRIEDADFAKETAELTRIAIQSQAGISVLTQANAMPQMILSLLQ